MPDKETTEAGAEVKVEKKVELKPVGPQFGEGTIEHMLARDTAISKDLLKLKHQLFAMKLEGGDLVFVMNQGVARFLYHSDITLNIVSEISCTDMLLPQHNENSFETIEEYAGSAHPRMYREGSDEQEFFLMCAIAYNFFMAKFGNIKTLDDVTRPVPTPLFLRVVIKHRNMEIVYTNKDGILFAGRLNSLKVRVSWVSRSIQLDMIMTARGKDGYVTGVESFKLPYKPMLQTLEDLNIREMTPEMKEQLTERGKKYLGYTMHPSYVHYEGFAYRYGGWMEDVRLGIHGRIMIDVAAMHTLNSKIDDSWYIADCLNEDANSLETVNDDSLWMLAPVVYGFSFSTKDWVRMCIDNVTSIKFSETAFDELIIPRDYKDIFISCLTGTMPSLDSIEGKGNGKIFLLFGPPGTGKTMTAESVAEYLKRPLYYVSVGELGVSPEAMEHSMSSVMEVAQSWDAVVLLDEVDVFAAKREGSDIERNAMTAILLRLLERYNGVMFMTTNLLGNLDPAFISRATATIEYPALETENRKLIWRNLLKKVETHGLEVDSSVTRNLDSLARTELNGRAIKNCIRLAYSVSMSSTNKKLTFETLESIIKLSAHTAAVTSAS